MQSFLAYKAEAAGVAVAYVDPAYTSRTCAQCGNLAHGDREASRGRSLLPRAALLSTLEPAVTVALGAAMLHERFGPIELLGGALIITALVLLQLPQRSSPAVPMTRIGRSKRHSSTLTITCTMMRAPGGGSRRGRPAIGE